MEYSDLSLNSNFLVPVFEAQNTSLFPTMCKDTIYRLECGHPAEDHVDSKNCLEYQQTGVACDRENPANRDRVNIKAKERNGICDSCLRGGVGTAGHNATQRDMNKACELCLIEAKAQEEEMRRVGQRAREESIAEAKMRDEQMRRAEQRPVEESFAKSEERRKAHEARIRDLERQTAEKYARDLQAQEESDFDFMIRKSREEAEQRAHQAEMDEIERALMESMKVYLSARDYQDEVTISGVHDYDGGYIEKWVEIKRTTIETIVQQAPATAPAPPPPPPPGSAAVPPPPPPAPKSSLKKASPSLKPVEKPAPRAVDYSILAVGPQNYGRFMVGNRHQPIHESQEIKEPTSPRSTISLCAPAPVARLGGQIRPDVPAMRPAQGPVSPSEDAWSKLRRTTGLRKSSLAPQADNVDPKLAAMLAKRRTWETAEEHDDSNVSITPPESASNFSSRVSTLVGSTLGGSSTARIPSALTSASEDAWNEEDSKTMRAQRSKNTDPDQ